MPEMSKQQIRYIELHYKSLTTRAYIHPGVIKCIGTVSCTAILEVYKLSTHIAADESRLLVSERVNRREEVYSSLYLKLLQNGSQDTECG